MLKCESIPRVDITIPSLALTQIDDDESENQVHCRLNPLLWVQGHLAEVQKSLCLLLVFVEKFRQPQCQQKQTAGLPFLASAWKHVLFPETLKACNLETKPPRAKRGSICDPSRPVAAPACILCCLVPQNVMKNFQKIRAGVCLTDKCRMQKVAADKKQKKSNNDSLCALRGLQSAQ